MCRHPHLNRVVLDSGERCLRARLDVAVVLAERVVLGGGIAASSPQFD